MTQKFIKHPARSLVIDLSQVTTFKKDTAKSGDFIHQIEFFSTTMRIASWGFQTEPECDQVYDWVVSQVNPAVYGELKHESKPSFESHVHCVDMASMPDKTAQADIAVKHGNLIISESQDWLESTTNFNITPYTGERMDIIFSGIQRTLGYYSSLEPNVVMMVVESLARLLFESKFDISYLDFCKDSTHASTMSDLHKLFIDLGCITDEEGSKQSENIYIKTNVPF